MSGTRIGAVVLLAWCGWLAGCGGGDEPAPRLEFLEQVTIDGPAPSERWASDGLPLAPLNHVDPRGMASTVGAQLARQQAALAEVADRPGATVGELGEAYGRMGMLYLAYGFDGPARAALLNASTLAPRELRWHYYLGRLHQKRGDLEPAIDGLQRALAIRRNDLAALVWLAEAYRVQGRLDRAEALSRAALEIDPSCAAALYGLGNVSLSRSQFGRAIRYLEQALDEAPGTGSIHYALGMAYRGAGDLEQARRHVARSGPGVVAPPDPHEQALIGLRRGPDAPYRLGNLLLKQGKFQRAVEQFRRALLLDPAHRQARNNLAIALSAQGDLPGAMAAYAKLLREHPDASEARYNLGLLHAQAGNHGAAVEQFSAALTSRPGYAEAHFQLALALLRLGRDAEALEHLPRAVESDPGLAAAQLLHGITLARLGRQPEARLTLETGHRLFPDVWQIEDALGRLLSASPDASIRDGERALELSRQVERRGPMSLSQAQTLAMALAETGRFRDAIRWQQRAKSSAEKLDQRQQREFIEDNLARYLRGERCRQPWPPGAPIPYPLPSQLSRSWR